MRVLREHVHQSPAGLLPTNGDGSATKTLLQAGRPPLHRFRVFSNSPCSCCRESAGISRQKFFWLAQSMATNAAHDSSDDIVVQDSDIAFFLSERAGLAPTKAL